MKTFIEILGWLLVASPLIGLSIWMTWDGGWKATLTVWAIMAALATPVVGGLALLNLNH